MDRPLIAEEKSRYEAEFVQPHGLEPDFEFRPLDSVEGPRVLDLGAGFTSVYLRACGFQVTTVEHDPGFMALIRGYCCERGYTNGAWLTVDEWREQSPRHFDTVLVDHGPDTMARLHDLERIMASVDGSILFDDVRGQWAIPLRRVLDAAGFRHQVVWSRSGSNARSVVQAWRQ